MSMNAEVKGKWLAALRSGKYAQVKHALHRDGGYCCLGVLAEVAQEMGLAPKWVSDTAGRYALPTESGGCEAGYLPPSVRRAVGLSGDEAVALADMNDRKDMTFEQIADAVEASL